MAVVSLTPHPEVIMTPIEGEDGSQAVLLHLATHQYFSLNDTGLLIWNALAAGSAPVEIADSLTAAYDVGPEQAMLVINRLVGELSEAGLLGES